MVTTEHAPDAPPVSQAPMPPTTPPGQIEATPQPFGSHDAGAGGPADEYKRRLREERARSGTTSGGSRRGIPS